MISLYQAATSRAENWLHTLLQKRLQQGKEHPKRFEEKKGLYTNALERPDGFLFWVHGASVGEAQSALILIKRLLESYPDAHVMITTGTLTSSNFLKHRLPDRCFHVFYPLDYPDWTHKFLDHWKPDIALWMESELWPNMILAMKERSITACLVNARLSNKTYGLWRLIKKSIKRLLSAFDLIIAQSETYADHFRKLGATNVVSADTIKYSAAPLPCNRDRLHVLQASISSRPFWVYASTHAGEEDIACDIHAKLKQQHPDLLTIIVPRHPERGTDIHTLCQSHGFNTTLRGETFDLPSYDTDIYVANTLGELGLFYRAANIVCIGRSFSNDGGGGHNPIEAAQLQCAILSGRNIQYQQNIFNDMNAHDAVMIADTPTQLADYIAYLFENPERVSQLQKQADTFAKEKSHVIDDVIQSITPLIEQSISKSHAG